MIVVHLTNKRNMLLQCDLLVERNRWAVYLKVLLQWYRMFGHTLVASMYCKLDAEDKKQYASLQRIQDLEEMNALVRRVVEMVLQSFLAFVAEKEEPWKDLLPFNIQMDCMSSRRRVTHRPRADAQCAVRPAPPGVRAGSHPRLPLPRPAACDELLLLAARSLLPRRVELHSLPIGRLFGNQRGEGPVDAAVAAA